MRQKVNLILVTGIAATILFFSIFRPPATASTGTGFSYTHFLAYFVLAGSLALYFQDSSRSYLEASLIAAVFGTGIEVMQLFLPGRFFSFYDIMANIVGAVAITADFKTGLTPKVAEIEENLLQEILSFHAEHF